MRIAICDDGLAELNNIKNLVLQCKPYLTTSDIQITEYTSPESLLLDVKSGSVFEVFILDVIMPNLTGIELAKKLAGINTAASIIFATHSKEFAFDAFSVGALQYLLKPITIESMLSALNRSIVISSIETAKSIAINGKNGIAKVYLHNILLVECVGHTAVFYLTDGKSIQTKTLRESFSSIISPITDDNRFLRPHQSYVINMNHISRMLVKDFEMSNGRLIPIAKDKASSAKELYVKFLHTKAEA